MAIRRVRLGFALGIAGVVLAGSSGSAHKPITSPFTFNEDVFPILRQHCGSCHVRGGPAPMSLLTHADAVPWGESLRLELIAGHMPPWQVDAGSGFSNVHSLSGRELNVLLTWASGGTPIGTAERTPPALTHQRGWPLGQPDLVLESPTPQTLPADVQDATRELTIATGLTEERWLRAVDVLPEAVAAVRSVSVSLRRASGPEEMPAEELLALWVAGDAPVALKDAAFRLPAAAELTVRINYKKSWEYERVAITDRSAIGLYFSDRSRPLRRLALAAAPGEPREGLTQTLRHTIEEPVDALAIYPDAQLSGVKARVTAIHGNGTRQDLIVFRPRAGWARRYWFREPVPLPKGTIIETAISHDDAGLLPPGASPPAAKSETASPRLVLNVVSR